MPADVRDDRPGRVRNRGLRNVLFSAVIVGAVFGLLEAGLRIGGFSGSPDRGFEFIVRRIGNSFRWPEMVADRDLFWKLKPNTDFLFEGTFIASNSMGFRTGEVVRGPRKDVCRILYLGDSVTFGWQVSQEHRYSDVLERMLVSVYPSRQFETINLALPGYSSFQALRTFETLGRDLEPDIVVACVGANDRCSGRAGSDAAVAQRIAATGWMRSSLEHLRVYRLLRIPVKSVAGWSWRRRAEPRVPPATYAQNLKSLACGCREVGATLVVLGPLRARRLGNAVARKADSYREAATRVAQDESVRYVSCASMTEFSLTPNSHLFLDLNHPDRSGHILVAAHLFPVISDLVEAPGAGKRVARPQRGFGSGQQIELIAHTLASGEHASEAVVSLVRAYTDIGAYEDAIAVCLGRAEVVASSAAACAALADAYWLSGVPYVALETAKYGMRLDEPHEPAREGVARLSKTVHPDGPVVRPIGAEEHMRAIFWAMAHRRLGAAAQLCELAMGRYGEHAVFRYLEGEVALRQGDRGRALKVMADLADRHQLHGDAMLGAARCCGELRRPERALSLAEAAAEMSPFSCRAHEELSAAAERVGGEETAIRAAKRALALRPDSEAALATLKRLERE